MSTKTSKKMKGFMCHSIDATAVCTVNDSRAVILPRKFDHKSCTSTTMVVNPRLQMMSNGKYARLVDSPKIVPNKNNRPSTSIKKGESKNQAINIPKPFQKPPLLSSSSSSSSDQVFQVVVMRVSLHCQGCAGKVKKHLSKMEGVTSFSNRSRD